MGLLEMRRSVLEDATYLSRSLREADAAEIKANSGRDPSEVLMGALGGGICLTAYNQATGDPVIMCGVSPSPVNRNHGVIWMLGAKELPRHTRQFISECGGWLDALSAPYTLTYNFADARNEVHIRWLLWAGFHRVRIYPRFGVERRPFIKFARINQNVRTNIHPWRG